MEKVNMKSMDIVGNNIEKIGALFPNCITEVKKDNGDVEKAIDFDKLRQELSRDLVEGKKERYEFTWPDKRQAIVTANAPISKTLRPCREKSVDFDTTQNVYIEGDNLDALKLLQETYLGKIKMIYIDPPYNTGNDFVFEDDFSQKAEDYLKSSGDSDEQGNRLTANKESNGRFHTDWLNMMYPRLKLARNLLAEDGAVFISIDENEYANLSQLCGEVFGYSNFITSFVWQKKTGASDAVHIATITESILVYAKNSSLLELTQNKDALDVSRYRYRDEYFESRGPFYYDSLDRGTLGYHESLDYGVEAPDGSVVFPNGRTQMNNDGWRWKWGKDKLNWGIKNGFIEIKPASNKDCGWGVYYKIYLNVDNDGNMIEKKSPYKNLIQNVLNTHASAEAKELFGRTDLFPNPKPVALVKFLCSLCTDKNGIFMDFFAGSSTTAHALMCLNKEDGGSRHYIQVQINEECNLNGVACKEGYKTICDIGEERIRRAGNKIKEEAGLMAEGLDVGFRVFRIDDSNMKDIYYRPDEFEKEFLPFVESNIKEDRTPEDLLFQVMIDDFGIPLSAKIETLDINGKRVFNVEDGHLVACFDSGVTDEVVTAMAKLEPNYAVLRDSSYNNDSVAVNFEQIFKKYSPSTQTKIL